MKTIAYPDASEWPALARRPAKSAAEWDDAVRLILEDIRQHGDTASKKSTHHLAGIA